MDDLIRRSDALAAFEESTSAMPEKQGRRRIEEIPAVDAVDVVRCRECKCYPKDFDEDSWNWCCGIGDDTKPNDFCSYGQHREEDHRAAD